MKALWAVMMMAATLPSSAAPIQVWIAKPLSTKFVFGEVEFEASVQSEERVAAVELYLDGVKLGELVRPPYLLTVDAGFDNVEHEFKAVAFSTWSGRISAFSTMGGARRSSPSSAGACH